MTNQFLYKRRELIDLKKTRAHGLDLPAQLLVRADKVIE